MKEKLKKIMVQGGFSVIVAVVAMSLYLAALYFGNKYFEKSTQPASMAINENGEIYLDGFEKEKSEIIYIMWETDAGSITAVNENDTFADQQRDENSKNYVVNTNYDEAVKWSSSDADGYEYESATIRAIVYSYDETVSDDVYYMGTYVNEYSITVTSDGENVEEADSRYFGNPVRKGADTDWSQIYVVDEKEEIITYRYRTGNEIDDENIILCFESNYGVLSETDYEKGMYYCEINSENSDKTSLYAVSNVTVDKEKLKEQSSGESDNIDYYIEAYLVNEDVYNDAVSGEKISEESKYNKASLHITE